MEQHGLPILQIRDRSPVRGERNTVSPLREASFHARATEHSMDSPTPMTSCVFAHEPEDELTPGGSMKPTSYCASVRTVGYSTVGGKSFMSGRCPNCKRMVKSAGQICTPHATPPPSPWRVALTSPLRSPFRSPQKSPKNDMSPPRSPPRSPLRSPLRSPFKSLFGGTTEGDTPAVKPEVDLEGRPEGRRSRSPVRAVSRSPSRSPTRSPWNVPEERSPMKTRGAREDQTKPHQSRSRSPVRRTTRTTVTSPQGGSFFNGPRHAEEPVVSGSLPPKASSSTRKSRSLSPVRVSTSEVGQFPNSPVRSPYKGSFFDNPILEDESEASVGRANIPKTPPRKERLRSRSPLRSPLRSPFTEKGLRSPLRSPFRNRYAPVGTE